MTGRRSKVHPGARACGFRFRFSHVRTHARTDGRTNPRTQPGVIIDVKALVKRFVLLIWDTRKSKICGDQYGETSVFFACVCGCVVNGVALRQRHEYTVNSDK